MCDPGNQFKLCSCSEGELGVNFWKLTRGNSHEKIQWVGDIVPPNANFDSSDTDPHLFITKRLIYDLNHTDIFDFSYNPEDGDLLTVELGETFIEQGMYLEFSFKKGQFELVHGGVAYNEDGDLIAVGKVNQIKK